MHAHMDIKESLLNVQKYKVKKFTQISSDLVPSKTLRLSSPMNNYKNYKSTRNSESFDFQKKQQQKTFLD